MNPLVWFRENQKSTVAFFTVLLMGGFGALGVLSSVASNNAPEPVEAKTVAIYKGGTYTDVELETVWNQRLLVRRFEYSLANLLAQKGVRANSGFMVSFGEGYDTSKPEQLLARDQETVENLLWEKEADKLGVSVTDEAVMSWIDSVAGGNVNDAEIRQIVRKDLQTDLPGLIRLLKREFKIQAAFHSHFFVNVSGTSSPAEAFMGSERLNVQADCSVLALKVEDYVGKVSGSPTDSELKKLYEEGKYVYEDFIRGRPGFRGNRKASVGYFRADFDAISAKFAKDISDETAKEEYNRLAAVKDPLVYIQKVTPSFPAKDLGPIPGGSKDLPLTAPGTTDAKKDGKPEEAKPTEAKGAEAKATETKPAANKAEDKKGSDLPPSPKTEGEKSKKDADKKSSEKKEEKKVSRSGNAPVYVSVQQAEKKTDATSGTKKQENAAGPAKAGQKKDETKTAEVKKDEPKDEFRPFEDVKLDIKKRLVRSKVFDYISKSMKDIRTRYILEKRLEFINFENDTRDAEREGKEKPSEPTDLDCNEIVKKYDGFTYTPLDLMSADEFFKTELGKREVGGFSSVAAEVFGVGFSEAMRYDVVELQNLQDEFLVFYLNKQDAGIVSFEEAKSAIVDYWKRQKAIKLAKTDAEKKVKEVKASGKKLLEVFKEAKETGSFSWSFSMPDFSSGRPRSVIRLSFVKNVEAAGVDFMETVFAMKEGDVDFATNSGKSYVYVIQKNSGDIVSEADRVKNFVENWGSRAAYPQGVDQLGTSFMQEGGAKIRRGILEQYDAKFTR